MKVRLSGIVFRMEPVTVATYLHTQTGEFVIESNIEGYDRKLLLKIPKIDHMKIMLKYINQLKDSEIKAHVLKSVGSDEFIGLFHITLTDNGIYEDWIGFCHEEYVNQAKKWCKKNNIEYYI